MREQLLSSKMEAKRRRIFIPIIIIISVISVGLLIFTLVTWFKPPVHDDSAVKGTPTVDEHYLYGTAQTSYDYVIQMAANLYQQENGDVNLYFTNPLSNSVLLRCEIIDRDTDKVLYKTGYIVPGEYIESVNNSHVDNKAYDVIVKVYAYVDESFESAGTTELSLKLQPW